MLYGNCTDRSSPPPPSRAGERRAFPLVGRSKRTGETEILASRGNLTIDPIEQGLLVETDNAAEINTA